jgi:hypothetical protein
MTITSWKLWRLLHQPPLNHPLFSRVILPTGRQGVDWTDSISGLLMLTPLIIVTGAVYGLGWATSISNRIAQEHQREAFDLLSVTPPGALGTSWTIALGCMYLNQSFPRLNTTNTWFARSILLAPFLFILWTTLMPPVATVVFLSAIYIDYFQSIVLGCLVGMIAPTYARNRLDARFLAFGVYSLLQITIYVAFLLATFFILPHIYRLLNLQGWLADWSLSTLCVAVLYLLREGVILAVWHTLLNQLNATADIDALPGGAV